MCMYGCWVTHDANSSDTCPNSRFSLTDVVIGVITVITMKRTFPRPASPVSTAQGPSHGLSHETTAMAIKKPITSSARRLTSAFCMWGPAVTMVPGPAFACEQLRQPSGVSRTHNRKTLVVLLNRFSLLPSWFREGWGDVQTQHAVTMNSPWKFTHAHIKMWYSVMCNCDDSFSWALLTKLKVSILS